MIRKIGLIILLLSCGVALYFSFKALKQKTELNAPLITSVPKDAALILELKNPIKTFYSLSETNLIWNRISSISAIKNLNQNLKSIDSTLRKLNLHIDKPLIASFHQGVTKMNSFFSFTSNEEDFNQLKKEFELVSENDELLYSKKIVGTYFYYLKPFTLIATDKNLLEKSINQLSDQHHLLNDSSFKSLYQKSETSKHNQVFIGLKNLKKLATNYLNKETLEKWGNNKNWINLDIILSNNQLLLNGLASSIRPVKTKIHSSRRINAQLLPKSIQTIEEITFDNTNIPERIINTFNNACNCNSKAILSSQLSNHISLIQFGKNEQEDAIYFQLKDSYNLSSIQKLIPTENNIQDSFETSAYPIKKSSLNTLVNLEKQPLFYAIYKNQLVISTASGIKKLTYEWKKNRNKQSKSIYSNFSEEYLAQKATKSMFTNIEHLSQLLVNAFLPAYHKTIKNIERDVKNSLLIGYQTNQLDKKHTHEAIIIKTTEQNIKDKAELWSLTLKHKVTSQLQLLKNHRSNSLDLFLQDSTHNIYLINAVGNIKWTKQLKSNIIGKVQQIDIYGNGKYQALFNTEEFIYLLDINGNNVNGFPVKLPKKATNSVTIFDYSKNNNYRFWIACNDKTIYNFNKDGKAVKGWAMPKSNAIILNQFERTVFNGKDYIYTIDIIGNVLFLNRKGESNYKLNTLLKARNGKIQLQKRASLNASSFIYQEDSSLSIVEHSLGNTEQTLVLNKKNKAIEFEIMDFNNNKFIDYLGFYQNNLELYGTDKTLLIKKEFLFNLPNQYRVFESITGKKYIVLQPENTTEIIILDQRLEKITNKELNGSLNTTIGDLNRNGQRNVVTLINNETIKVYDLN